MMKEWFVTHDNRKGVLYIIIIIIIIIIIYKNSNNNNIIIIIIITKTIIITIFIQETHFPKSDIQWGPVNQ